MKVKVKICGITSPGDGLAAASAGADMIGLMFYEKSPRFVPLDTAVQIARAIPPHVLKVGVFVNAPEHFISTAIAECGLGLLQFHGDEPPAFCSQFGVMSMKAFRIRDEESLKDLPCYRTDAWLLDAHSPTGLGGTGDTFNWKLAVDAKRFGKPIFLAGGLTPDNVAAAVCQVKPFGLDVSSGVESAPGKKDPQKLHRFIAAARSVHET